MSSAPMTNGEKPQSKVLSHLQSYPVVHDSLEIYKSNPYGAKSLDIVATTYQRFVAPFAPYLQTPYSYVRPYLTKADELGDNGLDKVDNTFPIVKEDTNKLKEHVQGYAFFPLRLAGQSKDYVLNTYNDEYSKTGGDQGLIKTVKAGISTELRVGLDAYGVLVSYLHKGKEQTQKKADEIKN